MSSTPTRWSSTSLADDPGPTLPYRRDIDGLRALAVLLVVVYHVWLGRVSGGVDVFLMISAYFLTATFVRRIEGERRLALGSFWVRRFVRLLPAAAITLVAVLATAWLVYPSSQWPSIWSQTWAALFYVQNWELAHSAVDYYDRGAAISPLQHFWSLSVQGQVFLLWPVLLAAAAVVIRRTDFTMTQVLTAVFGGIFVASLAYSIVTTGIDQRFAYFDTFARLWEFAIGSLLAVWGARIVLTPLLAAVTGWLGLVALILCGVLVDVRGGFPGYLALWPTLAAAAVMVGGSGSPRGGPSVVLNARPLQFLGKSAYALYLVHWPNLVTWWLIQGHSDVGAIGGTLIILLSVAVGILVSRMVENPVRRSRWIAARTRNGLTAIIASVVVVAAPLVTWQVIEATRVASIQSAFPGALVLVDSAFAEVPGDVPARPQGSELPTEWVTLGEPCTGRFEPTDPLVAENCMQTEPESSLQPVVLVVGDSHAQQWMGALTPLAARDGWQLVAILRGGCTLALDEPGAGDAAACDSWRAAALEYVEEIQPDAVMTMGTSAAADSPH
ncbi:MAG: acyltransferase family protein, partial [Microbacterium sp.]